MRRTGRQPQTIFHPDSDHWGRVVTVSFRRGLCASCHHSLSHYHHVTDLGGPGLMFSYPQQPNSALCYLLGPQRHLDLQPLNQHKIRFLGILGAPPEEQSPEFVNLTVYITQIAKKSLLLLKCNINVIFFSLMPLKGSSFVKLKNRGLLNSIQFKIILNSIKFKITFIETLHWERYHSSYYMRYKDD